MNSLWKLQISVKNSDNWFSDCWCIFLP